MYHDYPGCPKPKERIRSHLNRIANGALAFASCVGIIAILFWLACTF